MFNKFKERKMAQQKTLSTMQKFKIGATIGLGVYVVVWEKKRVDLLLAGAREAGVNDWLREMADNNLTIMVLTQDLADKMFTAANDAVSSLTSNK